MTSLLKFVSKRTTLSVVAAICLSIAARAAYLHQRYQHFAVHVPGKVYRSAWLEADVIAELVHAHNLRAVVNLCQPGEMGEERWRQERAAVAKAGARLIEIPLPVTLDVDAPEVDASLRVLADEHNYPMLVHCKHGVTRTAEFLTIYDIARRGMTAAESLDAMPLFGRPDQNVQVRAFAGKFQQRGVAAAEPIGANSSVRQ